MVYRDIQGPIPIEGRGFVARPRGDFKNGEFRRLTNMVLDESRLVNRRNIRGPMISDVSADPNYQSSTTRDMKFIGFHNHLTLYASGTEQIAYDNNGFRRRMFNPSDVMDQPWWIGGNSSGFDLEGFFIYNNRAHWIYYLYDMGMDEVSDRYVELRVLSAPEVEGVQVENYAAYGLSNTENSAVRRYPSAEDWKGFSYVNHFVFKDRLWLVTPNSVQFSAATQPDNFVVDEGAGFFNINDDTINHAVAIKDTIYLFCSGSIYALTYQMDPNEDATMYKVADHMGGLHGCIHRDTPFFLNKEGVFMINNMQVEKVAPAVYDYGINDYNNELLVSFENNLIVHKGYKYNALSFLDIPDPLQDDENYYYRRSNLLGKGSDFAGGKANFMNHGTLRVSDIPSSSLAKFGSYTGRAEVTTGNTSYPTMHNAPNYEGSLFDPDETEGRIPVENDQVYTFSFYINNGRSAIETTSPIIEIEVIDEDGYPSSWGARLLTTNCKWGSSPAPGTETLGFGVYKRFWATFTVPSPGVLSANKNFRIIPKVTIDAEDIPLASMGHVDAFLLEANDTGDSFPAPYFSENASESDPIVDDPDHMPVRGTTPDGVPYIYRSPHEFFVNYVPAEDKNGLRSTPEGSSGNYLGYSTYMINTDNGNTSVLDYKPVYNKTVPKAWGDHRMGFISHLVFNPTINPATGTASLFILSHTWDVEQVGVGWESRASSYVNYMEQYGTSSDAYDHIVEMDGTQDSVPISNFSREIRKIYDILYDIEVDSFVPDGNEYLMKKYRNFEIMSKFPSWTNELKGLKIGFAYGERDYKKVVEVHDNLGIRPHYPHRIGLNQRARSLNVRLFTDRDIEPYESVESGADKHFEISDMRVIWGYTQYAAKNHSGTNS